MYTIFFNLIGWFGNKMSTYGIRDMANKLGVSIQTMRNWDKSGKLVAKRRPSGHRYYTHDQYLKAIQKTKYTSNSKPNDDAIKDKVVLITGGTGSLGNKLTERIKSLAKKVIIFSRCELKQHAMKTKFKDDSNIRYFLGDIRDKDRLKIALKGADICIHAAALKRIERCTSDPMEAVKTNVEGSMNIIEACMYNDVNTALLVSTDKAAAPSTIYGGTKFVAEQLFINSNNYSTRSSTKFIAVRYGNVFASNGSIIHLFKEQSKSGEVNITHKDMTRFFMSLDDSVDLILHALNNSVTGGELFVPKMKAISIERFADIFAPNVPKKIIGLRGYEKIHETLITDTEMMYVVDQGSYFKIIPPHIDQEGIGWDKNYEKEVTIRSVFKYSSNSVEQFSDKELIDMES